MTTPYERKQSLIQAYEFLQELSKIWTFLSQHDARLQLC